MSNIIYSLNDLPNIVKIILSSVNHKVIGFFGDMGSGKTTLIKSIIKELKSHDSGNSPTYGLVHEYRNSDDKLIAYHFDCYRLESAEEALDIGLEEYLGADCWIFIEWPEKIAELLPAERSEIHIRMVDSNTRELVIHNLPA
jgi:tRNA threonylcarbamoyladenosine biosynthesis protein TsaE